MKKIISLALAIVMIMCLSTTAFAVIVEAPGDYTADVTGSYVAGNESNAVVYCVDITWSDLDFTYHAEKGAVWDVETLKYSEETPAYWEGEGTITITNRSNTNISATPAYAPAEGYGDADMDFSTDELKVASAEIGTAQSGTITVTPNGFLPAMNEADTIGTITLTIAQNFDILYENVKVLYTKVYTLCNDWEAAGGDSDDSSTMRTHATVVLTHAEEFKEGLYSQENLNSDYDQLLAAYNSLKAKYNSL